jgi:hypothetical protein
MSAELDNEWAEVAAHDADIDSRSVSSLSDQDSDEDAASAYSNNVYSDGEEDTLLIITHQKLGIGPRLRARRASLVQNASSKASQSSSSKPHKMLSTLDTAAYDGINVLDRPCHACQCQQDRPLQKCMICSLPHGQQIAAHAALLKKLQVCEEAHDIQLKRASELQVLLATSSKATADAKEESRKISMKHWVQQSANAEIIKNAQQKEAEAVKRFDEITSSNEIIREEKVRVVQRNYLLQQELGGTLQKLHMATNQVCSLEQMHQANQGAFLQMEQRLHATIIDREEKEKRLHATINELEQKVKSYEETDNARKLETKYKELEMAGKRDNEQASKVKDNTLQSMNDELKHKLAATEQALINARSQAKEHKAALDATKASNTNNLTENEILRNIKANAMKALEGLDIAQDTMTALEQRLFPKHLAAAQAISPSGARQVELASANEQHAKLQSVVAAKDKTIADLRGELKSTGERLTIYQNTARSMGGYMTRARTDNEAKDITINDLKKRLEHHQTGIINATRLVSERNEEIARQKVEITKLTDAHRDCEAKQSDLQKKLAERKENVREAVKQEQHGLFEKEWESRAAYVEEIMDEMEKENDQLKEENHKLRHQVNRAAKKQARKAQQEAACNNQHVPVGEISSVSTQSTSVHGTFVRSNSSPVETLTKVVQPATGAPAPMPKIVVARAKLDRALTAGGDCNCLCACECHLHSERSLYGCECPGCKCNKGRCDGPSSSAPGTQTQSTGMTVEHIEKLMEEGLVVKESTVEAKGEEVQPQSSMPGGWI